MSRAVVGGLEAPGVESPRSIAAPGVIRRMEKPYYRGFPTDSQMQLSICPPRMSTLMSGK